MLVTDNLYIFITYVVVVTLALAVSHQNHPLQFQIHHREVFLRRYVDQTCTYLKGRNNDFIWIFYFNSYSSIEIYIISLVPTSKFIIASIFWCFQQRIPKNSTLFIPHRTPRRTQRGISSIILIRRYITKTHWNLRRGKLRPFKMNKFTIRIGKNTYTPV